MEVKYCYSQEISDESHVAEARREGQHFAEWAAFDKICSGKLAIVLTEIATNILKHAREGELIIQAIKKGTIRGVEVLGLDKGPGMSNVEQCLRDGFTTAGTQGSGLGAIQRQSDQFDISSSPAKGTIVQSRIWSASLEENQCGLSTEGISIPIDGENISGDQWAEKISDGIHYVLLSDGLGHGPLAAAASFAAIEIFMQDSPNLSSMLQKIHVGLKDTRGAAIAVAAINYQASFVEYAGVGNITGMIIDGSEWKHTFSSNGIIGHTPNRFQSYKYNFPATAILLMYSDGVQSRLNLQDYADAISRPGNVLAGALYRDYSRRRDDTTIITVRRAT